jgi:diguanylate cyclase (GGDEF)-like protein
MIASLKRKTSSLIKKERSNMNFENVNQAIIFIQMLHEIYSVIRFLDADSREILYDSEDSNISHGTSVFCTDCKCDAIFCIKETVSTTIITITVPVTINGRSCHLELIQRAVKHDGINTPIPVKQEIMFHRMQELSITDPLTNLFNRRYIDEQLPIELVRAFQNDDPVSVIYADIDYFKKINDQYGHIVGDLALKEVVEVFRHQVRKKDGWIARYGGEEFLICLPKINRRIAVRIANRIRRALENKHFCINAHHLKITCSFGVQTIYKRSGADTVDKVVALADKKLYQAKKEGRNRVVG